MQSQKDLLDRVEHAVFLLEPDAIDLPVYAAMNAYACRALAKSEDEVIGKSALELYPNRSGKIAFEHHLAVMRSGKARSYELLLPLASGLRRVRTTLNPCVDDTGRVWQIVGSSTDISEQQIVREMQASTHTLNHEMEDFVSLAAHDLRAPMRNVKMIADMLREDFHDHGDGKLELIDMLEDVGSKAMSMIADILSHSQITSTTDENVEFEFDELVQEVMGLLDPMDQYSCSAPAAVIEGNRTATQMILRNLIDNAIKYAASRGGKNKGDAALDLTITLKDTDGFFEVSLHDNGTGFSDTSVLFLSGDKMRTDSGFGMLGVRRLIHARGGTLTAFNAQDGNGAVVCFSLPGKIHDMDLTLHAV